MLKKYALLTLSATVLAGAYIWPYMAPAFKDARLYLIIGAVLILGIVAYKFLWKKFREK